MSYSLHVPCFTCGNRDKCTDRHFIEGAISGIHAVYPKDKGHLGSGSVEIKCSNFTMACSDPK
jgi:hypothetical protein